MPESAYPDPAAPNMLLHGEIEHILKEVRILDPALLRQPDTSKLIELGAYAGLSITKQYGTPQAPRWASGAHEQDVFMSYHNGGSDGHTSVGPQGVGVPRNVLVIARTINEVAGWEVYDPLARASGFYAGKKHDEYQLCGRALLPTEGHGEGRGDERLSAEDARDTYLAAGGDPETADEIYAYVMATAFNPQTGAQNVMYDAWRAHPTDPALTRIILGQELTAAADLFGATTRRGPLGAIEYVMESMCFQQKDMIMQRRLRSYGIELTDIEDTEFLLTLIGADTELREAFVSTMAGQAMFFADHLKYSDEAIRAACGSGIDELFPGRLENADIMTRYSESLLRGQEPLHIWGKARALAGYST